jgi:hypothetical protein
MPRPLYPQENIPWYPLDKRLGWHQSRSGRGGEKKNSQPPPGLEPPYSSMQLSAINDCKKCKKEFCAPRLKKEERDPIVFERELKGLLWHMVFELVL